MMRRGECTIKPEELAAIIDHTLLRANATQEDLRRLCAEAREYGFGAVCVNPCYVKFAAARLQDTPVKICTVVGFPLGANVTEVKVLEAGRAARDGVDEVDIVLNVGALIEGDIKFVTGELERVIEAARDVRNTITVKIILETGYLDKNQMILGCWAATGRGTGADYVKTSTGFGPAGATVEDVRFLRETVGKHLGVKAAGGIRDLRTALALVEAGADRLGTSAGVRIMREMLEI